jgi:hypothetical protein
MEKDILSMPDVPMPELRRMFILMYSQDELSGILVWFECTDCKEVFGFN